MGNVKEMTVLISGSTGFLGSYLIKRFFSLGFEIVALKRSVSDTNRVIDLLDKINFYDIDIVNMDKIFRNHEIDLVINTVTDYGRLNRQVSSIIETNLLFSLKLLEKSVQYKVQSFINTDTLLERDISAYALSKAQFVDWMKFLSTDDTKMINIKIEHMYGLKDDDNKFIYWLIKQLKTNEKEIKLTSGIQKRDFIYIDDVVNAYETIVYHIDSLSSFEEFELGSGSSYEVRKLVNLLVERIKKEQMVTTKLNFGAISYRENENMDMKADISKLVKLGWCPKITIQNGINKILNGELQ